MINLNTNYDIGLTLHTYIYVNVIFNIENPLIFNGILNQS